MVTLRRWLVYALLWTDWHSILVANRVSGALDHAMGCSYLWQLRRMTELYVVLELVGWAWRLDGGLGEAAFRATLLVLNLYTAYGFWAAAGTDDEAEWRRTHGVLNWRVVHPGFFVLRVTTRIFILVIGVLLGLLLLAQPNPSTVCDGAQLGLVFLLLHWMACDRPSARPVRERMPVPAWAPEAAG